MKKSYQIWDTENGQVAFAFDDMGQVIYSTTDIDFFREILAGYSPMAVDRDHASECYHTIDPDSDDLVEQHGSCDCLV